MVRVLFVLACCAPSLVAAQARLQVKVNGQPAGTVQVTQRLLPTGQKYVQTMLERKMPNSPEVTIRTETTYNAKGEPVRLFVETVTSSPRSRRVVTVSFDDAGAKAVIEENGKRSTKEVPLARPAPRGNSSEFWFVRDQPKPGQSVSYFHFDANQLDWRRSENRYVGQKKVRIGDQEMTVHVMRNDRGEAWADSKGLPVRIDLGFAVMERVKP